MGNVSSTGIAGVLSSEQPDMMKEIEISVRAMVSGMMRICRFSCVTESEAGISTQPLEHKIVMLVYVRENNTNGWER